MRSLKVRIAGYIIELEASREGPGLSLPQKFLNYLTDDPGNDIRITVTAAPFNLPLKAERVFHAPFVEEINGDLVCQNPEFWSVWKDDSRLFLMTSLPQLTDQGNALLEFSLTDREWHLHISTRGNNINPFEYPLDGLILYYLTVMNNDIMIHAAGVGYENSGYIFTGISGKGKSTMAGLWAGYGADVIHDDRLIIRKTGNIFMMFNTPVYDTDNPREAPLDRIFLIEHGRSDKLIPVKEASAVSLVMANCIQHSWDPEMVKRLLMSVSEMCNMMPVYKLAFLPGKDVIALILGNEEE